MILSPLRVLLVPFYRRYHSQFVRLVETFFYSWPGITFWRHRDETVFHVLLWIPCETRFYFRTPLFFTRCTRDARDKERKQKEKRFSARSRHSTCSYNFYFIRNFILISTGSFFQFQFNLILIINSIQFNFNYFLFTAVKANLRSYC